MPTDDVVANPGAGGANFRFLADASGRDWQPTVVSYATTLSPGANVLQVVTPSAGLPVAQQGVWSVSVGNFPASQPVSGPLTDTQLRASAIPVSGAFFQGTQPVSATSLPLPSGASQEHVGAGSPHAVRLTDGAAFYKPTTPADTQPVSGTLTANVGTTGGLALDATLIGGAAKAITRGAGKGGTAAADATVSVVDADHNALDVWIRGGGGGGSGGTQYTEDVASVGAESLMLAGAIRRDAAASSSGTDGDYSTLNTDGSGRLWVNGSGVTQPVSGTVTANAGTGMFTVGGTVGVSGTVTVDSELTTADLDTGVGTDTRAVVGLVYGASGGGTLVSTANPLPIGDNGGSLTVDGTVSITANSAVNVAQVGGTTTDTNSGNKSAGTLRVVIATDQPTMTNGQPAIPTAATTGGGTPYHLISAASTNATSVKGSAGTLYSISAFNTNAAARYLKIYDKATAPSVGSDTPVLTFLVPGGGAAGAGMGKTFPVGVNFANGIAIALTTGAADADTGAVAANELVVDLVYK